MTDDFVIYASLLSLASNVAAEQHLAACREALSCYGAALYSPLWLNDCQKNPHAQAVPVYHNQVAVLHFAKPMGYADWVGCTKQLELDQGRDKALAPLVSLDVDILAIQTDLNTFTPTNQPTNQHALAQWTAIAPHWLALTRRLPLASYDVYGVAHLPSPYPQIFQTMLA